MADWKVKGVYVTPEMKHELEALAEENYRNLSDQVAYMLSLAIKD